MAYLERSKRRTEILDAVIRTAAVHGFDGSSVRRVCLELGISSGNVHHLFGSVAELKLEAFRQFASSDMARVDAALEKSPLAEQLHSYLSSVAIGTDERSRKIWGSASAEAARDEEFARVMIEETEVWRERVSELLIRLAGEGADEIFAEKAAWRLIAFVIGITSYSWNSKSWIDDDQIEEHLRALISYELQALTHQAAGRVQTP